PGYRGVKTTLIERAPSVTSIRSPEAREPARDHTRHQRADHIFAEIRYRDDSGAQTFLVTQNEVSVGRGGEDLWLDLAVYTTDEISGEHVRLRRDASRGGFRITDLSRNGTWVNGRRLARNVEVALPERAEISLAQTLKLSFEARRE